MRSGPIPDQFHLTKDKTYLAGIYPTTSLYRILNHAGIHAFITPRRCVIEDPGSTNGTFVNGAHRRPPILLMAT